MPNPVQTVTIAQALASSASGLLVLDTGANIANALPNAALTSRVSSYTLSGAATLSAAQTLKLAALGAKFHNAGNVLMLSDTLASIDAAGNASAVALANIVEATDTAANLLAASVQNLAHVSAAAMTGTATVSVAQLTQLEALPYFQLVAGARLTVADTATNIAALLTAHPAWLAEVTGITVQLDGSTMLAWQATELSNLIPAKTLNFVASGANTTLHVTGAAANLANDAVALNRLNNLVTKTVTVANPGATLTVAQAQAVEGLSGISLSGSALVLADSGAAITQNAGAVFGQGFAQIHVTSGTLVGSAAELLTSGLQFQGGATAQLSASFVASAPQAASLAGLPGFSLAHGVTLTVSGAPASLLANGSAWQAVASSVQVTANATLSAADATSLENIARQFGARFSLNAHTITVADTGHDLATLPSGTIGLASGFLLSASGNVSVADLAALRSLSNFSLNGFALTVSDTATNLLRLGGNASPATSTQLSANAGGLTASQFTALSALPGFSAAGHSLGLQDSVTNLLGLQNANLSQVSSITLSAAATVSASVANQLAAEHGFTAGTYGLTVQDTAANLLTLSNAARAVASSEILPSGHVTLTASQGVGLAALPHFSAAGATITISDTVANLSAGSSWGLVASTYDVVDTAANLAAAETSNGALATLVHGATEVTLSAPATNVSAATVGALAGIASFATDGTALAVADTAANLVAHAGAVRELASAVSVTGPATLSLSQAASLAGIAGVFGSDFSLGGNTLTLAGTPSDLLGVTQAEAALIGAYELNAAATVSAQTFGVLRALPAFSDNGFPLTLADTATNLLGLTGSTALVSTTDLTADATVNAAQYLSLAALPGLSANLHVLTVLDSAAGLYSLQNANLTPVSATELSGNAVMSVAEAGVVTAGPGFSANGFTITISDTAANLITLPHALQVAATSITLSADSTVTAAQLTELAAFGVKFFTDGHTLTVADTAANLAGLSLAAIGLATAEQINISATVTASVATTLAALPALTLANGVTLTVQDNAANLLALGAGAPAATTSEMLLPGAVTLSATQAAGLLALPHFSAAGATITVSDSVANLTAPANTGWSTIASATDVVDSAANLAAAASSSLVQNASLVTLSGNAVITAAQALQIASIPHFASGGAVLEVSDTAADIAGAASAVSAVAGQVVVSDSGPVSASQADALAGIAALNFARGVQLTVQDSFASLTSSANASGVALAARITVADSAANLVAASAYDWGGLNPSYVLTQGGNITAAQAITLASLGSHYSNGGEMLAVSDGAAAVSAAAASVQSLGITASVSDTAAAIGAAASGLESLGARLTSVTATDTSPVLASVAAGLSGLAGKLTSTTLTVDDSAAAITQYQSQLTTLGAHVRIYVTDTGADLVANATALEALATQVLLGDSPTLNSAGLATLAQVASVLGSNFSENGHSVTLQDSSPNILLRTPTQLALAASVVVTNTISLTQASALESAGLAAKLSGALAVSDTSQNLASDFSSGSVLASLRAGAEALAISVTGGTLSLTDANATAILGSQAALALMGDLAPATIVSVSGVPASGFAAIAASGWPNLAVTIVDSAADIGGAASSLTSALQHYSGTLTITLTDTEAVTAQIAADLLPFAQYLAGGTALAVTDSAADISSVASALTSLTNAIGTITLTGTSMDAPTAAAIAPLDSHLASGVRLTVTDTAANIDTNHVALAQLNTDGHLASVIVQNASIADIVAHRTAIDALPSHLVISDTAANIAADLTGGASVLSAESAKITSVTLSAGGIVGAAALRDMAALPGFSLGSATLALSDTASAIDTLGTSVLNLALTATIRDSAANVGNAAQTILTALTGFTGTASIALTDTAPASAQTAANLAAVASLLAEGTSLNVSDSAANVKTYAAGLTTLGTALGTITLQSTSMDAVTAAALAPLAAHLGQGVLLGVTDSSHAIAQNLTQLELLGTDEHLGTVTVSGESVATISPNISALNSVSAQVTISDTGDDVAAALSTLAGIHHLISITLTDSSAPTLTMALSTLQSDSGVLTKIVSSYTIQILDTAANIQSDIVSGGSGLIASTSQVTSVAVSNGATVSLSQSQLLSSAIGSTVQFTGALAVSGVDVADVGDVASRGATAIAVSDIAANITNDLASGNSVLATQARHGTLTSVTSTSGTHITLSAAQAEAAGVDDSAHSVIALLSGATLSISGAAISDLSGLASLYTQPASIAVSDSSANVAADLVSGHSALVSAGVVSVVSVTGGTLSLSGAQAHTILQTPSLISMVWLISQHNALSVTGASLADAHAIFIGEGWANVSLTVAESAADLANNQSELPVAAQVSVVVTDNAAAIGAQQSGLSYLSTNSVAFSIALTDSTPVSAAVAGALGAWTSHFAGGTSIAVSDSAANIGANAGNLVLLGSALGTITLTSTALDAADAAGLATLDAHLGLGVTVSVTDTAAQIDANLTNLISLQTAGKLVSVAVSAGSVSDVTGHVAALNTIGATVTISDTAANIGAGLATLASVAGLTSITASDGNIVDATWSISQLASDHAVLGKITGSYALTISDSASDIEADLALGSESVLRSYGALLSGVTVSGASPVYLTASQLLAAGIDTGATSALAHFSGTLDATNASVANISALLGRQTVPTSIAVSDTAQNIQNDLASGPANSMLLLHASKISSITVSGGAVTLTVSQAMAAGVDDGAGSAVAKITGMGMFTVTGVAVSQLASVLALNVVPVIDISDTAQNLENAVATLAADRAQIGAITQSDGAIFTITATQALTAGVADGAGSVLNLMGNPGYDVTGAEVSQIGALQSLMSGAPTQISVSDSSQTIVGAMIDGGSALAQQFDTYHALGTVTVTGGVLSVTADQIATAAGNGTGSIGILGNLAGGTTIDIQDVTVGDITSLLSYDWPGTRLEITDSASNLATDLTGGGSVLQAHSGVIGSVTLSAGGTVSAAALADMTALPSFSEGGYTLALADNAGDIAAMSNTLLSLIDAITVTDNAQNVGAHEASLLALSEDFTGTFTIDLTDTQPVGAAVAASVQPLLNSFQAGTVLAVSDTAASIVGAISALQALGSTLGTLTVTDGTVSAANAATISALASHLSAGLAVACTAGDVTANYSGLSSLQGLGKLASVTVTGASAQDAADNSTDLNAIGAHVSISDSASNVAFWIDALNALTGLQSITLTDGTPVLTLNVATLENDTAALGAIQSTYTISIQDIASAIQTDLELGADSALATNGHLSSITVVGGGSVILTQSELLGSAIGAGVTFTGTLAVTGVEVGDLAAVMARSPTSISVADTTETIEGDLNDGPSHLAALAHDGVLTGVQGSGGTITLTAADMEAVGVDDGVHSVAALLSDASLAVSGAHISDLATLAGLYEVPSIAISDSAANILAALATDSSLYDIASSVTAIAVNGSLSLTDAQAQTMLGDTTLDGLVTLIASANTVHITGVAVADLASIVSSGWADKTIAVVDGASAIAGANAAELAHAQSVTVSDSALDVGDAAASLETSLATYVGEGGNAVIDLTDSSAVGAQVAANLSPVASYLASGTSLAVSDAAGTVAAYASQLGELGNALGIITLASDNVDAATAAALQPLDSHLGSAVLNVTADTPDLAENEVALEQLQADGHLGTVTVSNASVDDVSPAGRVALLNTLNATVTIFDDAADVQGGLDALAGVHGLSAITLSDGDTPNITVSMTQLSDDQSVLTAIHSSFGLTVSGEASDIEADLASGADSVLAQFGAQIGTLTASDGNPVVLSQAQVLAAGIDDGAHSALAHFSGTLQVTGVDVAHVAAVFGATTPPASITMSDTASHLSADLASGNSVILQNVSAITSITVSDGGTLSLTAAQVEAGIAALELLHGQGGISVTSVLTSDLSALSQLPLGPLALSSISVDDTAAHISSEIALGGGSTLIAWAGRLAQLVVSDAGTISLTESQILAANVDDGDGSVLSKLSGEGGLQVTGVAAADLSTVLGLHVAPTTVTVSDTAQHLESNFSTLVLDRASISSIAQSDGAHFTLSADQALGGGAATVLGHFTGTYYIDQASVSQLSAIASLPNEASMGANVTVSDTSDDIVTDLMRGGDSLLAAAQDAGELAEINVTGGTITLDRAQALDLATTDSANWTAVEGLFGSGTVIAATGIAISDAATVEALVGGTLAGISIAIADSAEDIVDDLAGSDVLGALQSGSELTSVTLTQGGTVSAAQLTAMSGLPGFSDGGQSLAVSDGASAIAGLSSTALGFASSVTVSDSAGDIGPESADILAALAGYSHTVTIYLTDTNPVGADAASALAPLAGYSFGGNQLNISDQLSHIVNDAESLATLIGKGAIGTISPSDASSTTLDAADAASLAPLAAHLAAGTELIVADTAAGITANVTGLTTLYTDGDLASVTVSGATLSDVTSNRTALNAVHAAVSASVSAADVQNHLDAFGALNNLVTISLTGGGTPSLTYGVGDLGTYSVTLGKINTPVNIDVADTAQDIANDLLLGASSVLSGNLALLHQISVSDGNPVTLTQQDVLSDGAVSTAIANVLGSSKFVSTTEVTAVDLADVSNVSAVISSPITWAISDNATNVQSDLASYGVSSTLQSLTQGTNSLASITVTGGGTITLSAAIAETAGVDDSASSLLAKVSGATFAVDQAEVSDLSALDLLQVVPASIAISDLAARIASDLNLGAENSELLANRPKLATVAVNDGGTVALTAATALATHVDDGAGSIVAKLSGAYTLEVTGVAVSQLSAVLALPVAPTEITISDSATNIGADFDAGGAGLLAANAGMIQSVSLSQGGTVDVAGLTGMFGLTGFSVNGQTVILQDGAANIAGISSEVLNLASSVQVVDSGSAIGANIGGLETALSGYGGTVTITATGTVSVNTTQYTDDLTVLHDITGTGVITVTDTAAALAGMATTLNDDPKVGTTALSADATNISADTLSALAGLTDFSLAGHTISVSDGVTAILGVSSAIASYANSVTITGTNAAISGHLDALQTEFASFGGTLSISMSGGGITVSTTTFNADKLVLDAISSTGLVTVSDTAAALVENAATLNADSTVGATTLDANAQVNASALATLSGLTGFSVNSYQLNLQDTESGLLTLTAGEINLASSVTVSDTAAGIGASAASLATLLGDFTNGAAPTITLTDTAPVAASVAAALVPVVSYLANGTSLNVSASPTDVASYASGLQSLGSNLGTITLSTTTMNAATAAAIQPLDGHLANGVTLTVTGSASDINTNIAAIDQLNSDGHLASIQVQNLTITDLSSYQSDFDALPHTLAIADSASSIATDLTGGASLLTAEAAHISSVTLIAGGTVTAPALTAMTALPGFALGGYQLTVADLATNLLALGNTALGFAHAVQVQDTGGDVGTHIDALETKFSTTANFSMAVSGGNGCVSINATQFSDDKTVLDTITTQHAVTITDTASALAAIATSVNADSVVYATQLSANATVGATTLAALSTLTGFTTNSYVLTLAGAATDVLGLTNGALELATNVQINDTAADVGTHLATLSALSGYAGTLSITLSDASPAISVSATNFAADQVAIAAIQNAGAVTVSGSASQVAAIANTLANTASIGSVTVSDTAADIAANLPALETIAGANKLHVTLSDSSITANLVTPLLSLSGSLTNGVAVADTPAQVAALAESSSQAVTYLNTYGATLNASGSLGVNDAAALEALTNFHLGGNTLTIWDTASHLTAASASVLTNSNISGVYLKTTSGAVTVTAATAASLLAIPNFSSANPPGQSGSNQLTISDTAAHLSTYYSTLVAHLGQFTGGIQVNSSTTVTDSTLTQLQALHATAANGVNLTVRDTAGTIAANAVGQAASTYITPTTWQVSGNATISEAQAAILGGLSGISVGGYTLTLSLSGNTSISIADAAKLGNIASSLNLGANELLVSGTATQLGALTNTALGLVTPQLSDTFANILAVGNALLLKGTVTVTDSESISIGQASSFLGMLTTEGGTINPGSVSFANGNVESITDTIAHLQSLQASSAWTSNTSVHAGFSLVAADTVSNLINPSHTSYLRSLSGSTLLTSQTTNAPSAESLALLANAIHFSLGSNVLTISDSASELLSASNVDGLALAGVVELSGPDTVSAAGAEQLLGIAHFTLNQSLTITDTSDNLLDGVLAGDISGLSSYVHVELAGSEILDAQTAASLVALTGFTDPNGYLSIADSSSYLLASANLTAEEIASSVTLAGDETVSANTVLRLSELPHFTVGDNQLTLASDDYADAATLKAIGDLGSNFNADGHTVTVTAETLDLTPTEFSALQSDNIAQGGHVVAAISDASNTLTISGLGVTGDTIKIYDHTGSVITSTGISAGSFTVTAADSGMSGNFAVTDVSGGTESAPVVVLDAAGLETAVTNAGATFASYGQIEVDTGKYLNIYLSTASLPSAPALVYNATSHVISLDIPNQAPVALVTLGGSTLPSSLTAAEIFIKHHS